jgi:hypothetical protein
VNLQRYIEKSLRLTNPDVFTAITETANHFPASDWFLPIANRISLVRLILLATKMLLCPVAAFTIDLVTDSPGRTSIRDKNDAPAPPCLNPQTLNSPA